MAEFALLTDGFLQIVNLSQIEKGLEEGRTVAPAFVERKRGEVVDLTDSDAARLLAAGAVEKPGEGARARLEFARAQAERAQAELAAVEAQQPAALEPADEGFDVKTAKKPELEAAAEERGLDVQGTGADGNVTVEDLRAALEPTDQE
jgi:pyruvate/2-oxoglutarate dehydrogenase complex dihydrolipoamide acyltransferase (E2) component